MRRRGEDAIYRLAERATANVNLPRNAAKPHWRKVTRRLLWWLLIVEVWELTVAMWQIHLAVQQWERTPLWWAEGREERWAAVCRAREAVEHEAADCTAFLAFLVDSAHG